ncbi:uncharacterized protein LOC127729350 isoform X2 [Mytilus californianus]|uniref:uncharacterized protein LOC127729350 isoform X2 n=1 Tax=Mytilus californianus TaxID=6549 RepID=UPI0022481A46|nr:uncharacterized protein LOC127729350 isoform X2 [Mytilus californianus]
MTAQQQVVYVFLIFLGLISSSISASVGICSFNEEGTCDENAECVEKDEGNSFDCVCRTGYYGDGFQNGTGCADGRHPCVINDDCHTLGECEDNFCVCKHGFKGDGFDVCEDINECALSPYPCSVDADCANTDGSYECECKNGYTGNGKDCAALPRTCDEIFKTKPKSADGLYIIDPDGPDALSKVEVYCDFMPDMGVTIMNPKTEVVQVNKNKPEYTVEYEQQIPEIEAVADNSGFCFQYMSAVCRYKAKMLDGDDYWVDRNNSKHYTWGGAKTTGKCVCGQIGACPKPESNCVCDGTVYGQTDDGKIIEKDQLPIRKVHIGGLINGQKMDINLGPVTCGPKPFGFPIDCYEAKFSMKIKKNGPQIIDVDGPDGPANPILVQCDMESYPHVGITVIVHDQPGPTPPNTPIEYAGNNGDISKIIEHSAFCRQDVTYDCQDSPIMANGNAQIVDIDGNVKDYFPGGLPGRCACGLTGTCFDKTKQCNCDTVDGVRRQDFGPVTNKGDLPVGSVTSVDLGNNSTVTLGPLMCSRREFGYEANCEVLLQKGSDVSYTYWIDPDGPPAIDAVDTENVAPFPAQCVMVKEPPHGVTIIHHENENYETLDGSLVLNYYYVSALQFVKLRKRSVFCTQAMSFECTTSPLFEGGAPNVQWYDIEGNAHSYFNGDGSKSGCACALQGTCDGGATSLCNCDKNDAQTREDVGNLILKNDLPTVEVKGNGPSINVGPLKCYDTYPTCSDLFSYMYFNRFESEDMVRNGEYTINPDGAGGVESFKVTCQFPKTEIPILPGNNNNGTEAPDGTDPVTKCFDINYGNGITKEQVQALIDNSKTCAQELVYNCVNAPVIDHVHYDTCDGKHQPGFAGSNGEDMCACGVTGTCASLNGEVNECNCAIQDGQQRTDKGMIRDKSRLPVCEVCMTIDPVNPQQPSRSASYEVSSLKCSDYNIGVFGSCQARRESTNSPQPSDTVYIDPDGFEKGNPPFPVFCEILAHPPAGIVTIYPKKETNPVPEDGGMIIVEYFVYMVEYMKVVVSEAVFCEQEVYVLCNGAPPPTQRGSNDEWVVTEEGTIQCKEGACSCSDGSIHGGFVKVQDGLPVISVVLDTSTVNRKLHIGPLKCYDLYKDCHDIKVNKANTNSGIYRGNKYAIDPDGPGGVEFFEVTCDFKTDPSIGITIVPGQPDSIKVQGQTGPGSQVTDIVYPDVTPEQINALTKQSGFCSQGIQYECKETALINDNSPADGFYTTYGGVQSTSFGTGFQSDVTGCACVLTGTCPPGTNCHCDAKGPMVSYDYGILTDTNVMPIIQLNLGGQTTPGATATATVGDVRCGPTPFDLPKDCEEVYKNGFQKSGEFMIYPTTNAQPYMVYCDMEIVPGHGVTVVGHDHEDPTVTEGTVTETVTYNNASNQQVDGLTDVSQYCYQPIKYDCYNTHFIGYGKFYWTGTGGQSKYYLGTGQNSGCSCSGGIDKLCGGDQTRNVLETRKCSCDAGELQWRSDAGVFTNNLPVVSMTFLDTGRVNATGKITLGKLFCSQVEFDLNECDTGFNDCHEHATCTNKDGTFECDCKPGYQGKKVSGVYANGRNCYDDNECALGWCPHSAECENIPGSFKCKCKPGYTQELPEECGGYQQCKAVCKDIDECADPKKNNCSENAVCTNLQGSYSCRCKRGYRGDGVECIPVGICTCFGDPHCISYDSKFLHYQGDCQYVMSQDGCNGTDQTFKVLTKHWNKNIAGITDATWVEKVIFTFPGHVVELGQDHELKVDGLKRSIPVKTDKMLAQRRGKWIEVRTTIGVNVNWDGYEKVEVKVPPNYQDKMCGLCGNYNSNPGDDWTIGPACAGQGTITDNPNKFGNSYVDVSYKDANPQCSFDCNQPPPPKEPCAGMDMTLAKFYCDKVFDMNGKFKTCLEKMDTDGVLDNFYSTCIFDECKVTENREIVMCAIAENIVKECQDNYDTIISDWRTEEMCSPSCPVNMEYLTCGSEDRMRTCENTTTIETDSYEKCTADCYCKENMFLDGNKCVEYEQCGCLYDGFYYSVGESYTDQECTTMYTCQSDRSFNSRPLTCSENATCGLNKDTGVYGCYCLQGFMGDGEKCEFDPCGTNPCNSNENCVVKGESYICECQMGFQGECNNCQDIDECKTKTDECPPHSKCKNTVGSYTCQCIDGYQKDNERCKDINECKIGTATCGEGTKCMNKPGGYACEPCSAGSPEGKCCVCYGAKCNIPGEVCGTDGVTYSSEGDLIIARCEKGKKIGLDYRGPCLDSCPGENTCPGMQTCNISEETGKPECTCPPCSPEEVVSEVKVCSNTLDLYTNICSFKKIQCALDREDTIIENTISPCEEKKGLEVVTEWSEWSPCSVTCGNGTMTRDRQAMAEFDEYLTEKYPLNQASDCYKPPCVGSSCEGITCNTSQVCVESETSEGFCVCPDCTGHGEDPVCGKIGSQYAITYKNPCELSKKACDKGEPYEELYVGSCGTQPLNCTKMPRLESIRNDEGCLSERKVNLGKCDGGCGPYANSCCKPITKQIDVELVCKDLTTGMKKVDIIEDCECETIPVT